MSTPRAPRSPRDRKLYFAFGSNLWREQMARRCPNSPFVGIGCLNNFEWFINERRYANIAPVNPLPPARGNNRGGSGSKKVWGLVYELSQADEERLDRNEGVPDCYQKRMVEVNLYPVTRESQRTGVLGSARPVDMLIYIDLQRNQGHFEPKEEYVYRMNLGIEDALDAGVPERYVVDVMRPYISRVSPDAARRALAQRAAAATEAGSRRVRGGAARVPAPRDLAPRALAPRALAPRDPARRDLPRPQGLAPVNVVEVRPPRRRSQAVLAVGQENTAVTRATEQRPRVARAPQPSNPQQRNPQQSNPQQGTPQQRNPEQSAPQPSGPQPNNPQQGTPQQRNPQPSAPQPSAPQQSREAPVSRSKSLREAGEKGLTRALAGLGIRSGSRKDGGEQEGGGAVEKGPEQNKSSQEQSPEQRLAGPASGSGPQKNLTGKDQPQPNAASSEATSQRKDGPQKGTGESHS